MIFVDLLYQKVEDTLVKNQSGNFNNDEFNLNLITAQNDIFNFFMRNDGAEAFVHDALQPFIETYLAAIAQPIALPSDYRSKRSAIVKYWVTVNGSAVLKESSCDFLKTDEKHMTLESRIRKPDVGKEVFAYTVESNGINVFPTTLSGNFEMLYLRQPATAARAVTIDTVNEIEVYDAAGTTALEWPVQYFNTFHEAICFYQGFQVRESEVIQWLAAKQANDKR